MIEASLTIHYFVHPSGKRRLKADNPDFPEGEIKELKSHYKIGICSEGFSIFNLSFDLMITNPQTSFYGMSLRLPF